MLELLGWAGSIFFTVCAIPQTTLVLQQGHGEGLSWLYLLLWLGGNTMFFLYVLLSPTLMVPMLANYALNFIMIGLILWRKKFPRQ